MAVPSEMAKVAVVGVVNPSEEGVSASVESAVEGAGWRPSLDGKRILVKVNGVSAFITPGANTSPWVLNGVLALLRKRYPRAELVVADSDSSARRQFTRAATLWGYGDAAARHGARLLNLCDHGYREVEVSIRGYPKARVSRMALECDALVNLPVIKTHTWAGASCGMKNLYGFYDNARHNYHLDLDTAIVEMVRLCPPSLTVIDGTIGLESGGPVMGHPREVGVVIASANVVAADAVAFDLMGLGRDGVSHCRLAMRLSPEIKIPPADAKPVPFAPARQNLSSSAHWKIRHTPGLKMFLEYPPTFRLLSIASTLYQIYWYRRHGRESRRRFFAESGYAKQFEGEGSIYA